MLSTAVPFTDFDTEPPTLEISTGWAAGSLNTVAAAPSVTAGGVWEACGCREGHQVCWLVKGGDLELTETCSLPGIGLHNASRRFRFPSNLLPPLGLAQLPEDDSLLVSAAMHAPSGGVFVYQMRFERGEGAAIVPGAVVRRDSWFAASPNGVPTTVEPVGSALGVPISVAFDTIPEATAPRVWRTEMLLGGDLPHAVHARLTLDTTRGHGLHVSETTLREDRSRITTLLGTVAGTIGIAAPTTVSDESISQVDFLHLSDGECALTISRGGTLRLWQLQERGVQDHALSVPRLSMSIQLGTGVGEHGLLRANADLRGGASFCSSLTGNALGVAACLGGSVFVASVNATDARSVVDALSNVPWKCLGAPGALDRNLPSTGPVRHLHVSPVAGGFAVSALVDAGAASLWMASFPSALGPLHDGLQEWAKVAIEGDIEQRLAADDPATAAQSTDAPIDSLMDVYVRRLMFPSRFAPRHLAAAYRALLSSPASSFTSSSVPAMLAAMRGGFDARVLAIEAESSTPGASCEAIEQQLGDSLLSFASALKASTHEIVAISSIGCQSSTDSAIIVVLTGARLCAVSPPLCASVSPYVTTLLKCTRAFGSACLTACRWTPARWSRRVLLPPNGATLPLYSRVAAVVEDVLTSGHAAAAPPHLPTELSSIGDATALMRTIDALLTRLAPLSAFSSSGATPAAVWPVRAWCAAMLTRWQPMDEPAAVAAAHNLAPFLANGALFVATAGADTSRDLLLLVATAQRQQLLRNVEPILAAVSVSAISYELLAYLATQAPATSSALASSALEQLLRAAPLPMTHADALVDSRPCAAALLDMVHRDVCLAREGESHSLAQVSAQEWGMTMSSILHACKLWQTLDGYVRLLSSRHPLHTFFAAQGALHAKRYELAARQYRAAVDDIDATRLSALVAAAHLPELSPEINLSPDEAVDWSLYIYASAVWRAFKSEGQDDIVIRFAQPTLELHALRKCAPSQCASLAALVFSSSLALGRVRDAYDCILQLDHFTREECAMGRGASHLFAERKLDCLRSLVSTLHAKGALHVLAMIEKKHIEPESTSALAASHRAVVPELHEALLWHARASPVCRIPSTASPESATPTAYDVAYALQMCSRNFKSAAACQFELATRLEMEWEGRIGARCDEVALILNAHANALQATIAALELVEAADRWVIERQPNRAAKLTGALTEHYRMAEVERDDRGLATSLTRVPAHVLRYHSANAMVNMEGVGPEDAESVRTLAERLEHESRVLRQAEANCPENHFEGAPVQIRTLRQRCSLSLARCALLAAGSPSQPHQLPVPARGVGAYNEVTDAVAVLYELIKAGLFDSAIELSVHYAEEMRRLREACGLPLVAFELAAHCVRLDRSLKIATEDHPEYCNSRRQSAGSSVGPVSLHAEWVRLQLLLERHDCEKNDYELGTAAVRGALSADATRYLPLWLVRHINPPEAGTPIGTSGLRAPLLLRVSARAARADFSGALDDNDVFVRAVEDKLAAHAAANARLVVRGNVAWGGDACVVVPQKSGDQAAASKDLVFALRAMDPGCRPLRRNPAALVRCLISSSEQCQLLLALQLVQSGCEAALAEKDAFDDGTAFGRRDRWVTCGLIDQLHAAVARLQGVAPWEADACVSGPLQPELSRCFEAVEAFLDIDLPSQWLPSHKLRLVSDAVVDGEWDVEPPHAILEASRGGRQLGADGVFKQMVEAAIRR